MSLVKSILAASFLIIGVTNGINPCLDSTSLDSRCGINQNSLNLANCGLTNDDAADITACINSLDASALSSTINLNSNDLTEISADWFVGLEELQIISIENNKVTELKLGIFDNLGRLEGLWINNNNLTTLPAPGLFSEGAGSTNEARGWSGMVLVFDGNLFTELPDNVFTGAYVSEVSMEGCFSGKLPFGDLFAGLDELDYLNLAFNNLKSLPENVFSGGLVDLQNLDLNDNDLTTLPENVFDGLDLSWLDLTGNDNLECLPPVTASYISLPDSYDEDACASSGDTCGNHIPGIQSEGICCSDSCGECGGKGCGSRPGGPQKCCLGYIAAMNVLCSETNAAPCVIDPIIEASTCSNGLAGVQQGDACCSETCGTCGGKGCSLRWGGASSCCVGTISKSGVLCSELEAAPCVVDEE